MDNLSVSPGCQGKGYGSLLIEAGCDRARKLGHLRMALLVEVDSARAKRLYERGWVPRGLYQVDRGTGILSHGSDFVMQLVYCEE
jgi:ribosomal protein S18 acetylase RimI-like enzyme